MTGMEHAIEQVAQVLIRHPLSQPQGGTASGAFVLCGCGTVINGASRDHAHAKAKGHVAGALAEAGLLASAPLREERADAARAEAGRRWGWPSVVKPNSEMTPSDWHDEGMASGFVVGALWAADAVDRAEGDGRAVQ